MAGGARAATSGILGFLAGRDSCLVMDLSAPADVYVLCHEARGMDLSPGEQIFVSLRDTRRSDPEKLTVPGLPWHLRGVSPEAVLQVRAWAAVSEELARGPERRALGELRLPLAQLKMLGLEMLYQTWITLDPPAVDSAASGVSAEELEQKMSDGCRQLFQPKLCLSLKAGSLEGGKMALALDAPPEVRHEAWNALLRSHLQHCTMSAQLHRHGLQAPPRGSRKEVSAGQIQDASAQVSLQAQKIQELRCQLRGEPRAPAPAREPQVEAKRLREGNEELEAQISEVQRQIALVAKEANGKIDQANEKIRSLRSEKEAALKEADQLRLGGERLVAREEELRRERQQLAGQKEALLRIVEDLHQTCKSAGMTSAGRHSMKDIGDLAASYRGLS